MKRKSPIAAIDGPVGVGKSTVARQLARRLNFLYIDTGAMYRALTLKAMRAGLDLNDQEAIASLAQNTQIHFERPQGELRIICDDVDVSQAIRLPEVSAGTSSVADNPEVRKRLVTLQQEMGRSGGVVMEGRDIGTVVFPDAEVKIYLDADPKIRAQRRYKELKAQGKAVTFEDTLQALIDRDKRDRHRTIAPLIIASDAQVIDTTQLTQEQVVERLAQIVTKAFSTTGNCSLK